jgi:hypothetical protein
VCGDRVRSAQTRLEHVRANVADLRRAVRWYEETLSFEVDSYWPPDTPNYAHFKAVGGATFAIMEAPGRGARFNFTVEDPDALWDRLKDDVTSSNRSSTRRTAPESSRSPTPTATSWVSYVTLMRFGGETALEAVA